MSIYIFESPDGIDHGLDLSTLVQSEHVVNDILHVFRSVLLVEQVTQVEAGEGLVFIEQLDGRDFVDLPPLKIKFYVRLNENKQFKDITDRATLKKLLVSPVTTLDDPKRMYLPMGFSNP